MADCTITAVTIAGVNVRASDRTRSESWTVANDNDVVPEADADGDHLILDGRKPVFLDDILVTTTENKR